MQQQKMMQPLPFPADKGDINLLWRSINVEDTDRVLVLAYLLECWRPDTPFPVLEIVGQQGSGKSETQEFLRRLIDPNRVNLRGAPKNAEDIFVGAGNSWLVSLNNLSGLTPAQQDATIVEGIRIYGK